jgi:replicative DNA helicase
MSEASDNFKEQIEAAAELDKKKKEVQEKEFILREKVVNQKLENLKKTEDELQKAKEIDYGLATDSYIEGVRKDNIEYIEAAQNPIEFINEEFDSVVPFFRKNLIVVGGKTGEGKSTAVANIILSTIRDTNPITGKPRRCLVITNEEKPADIYNRVTCLAKGIPYVNHNKFTKEQAQMLDHGIKVLSKSGLVMVIEDIHEGVPGTTTTIEGIKRVFDNLIAKKDFYDVVLIDYYQNFKYSKSNPGLGQYQIQELLSTELDLYKNVYPAPIVVMAQVKPPDQAETPFNIRIKGSKSLPDRATLVIEMVADRANYRTEWIVHKSRFTEGVIGQGFFTGYDKGRFVPYDNVFMQKVLAWKEEKTRRMLNKEKLGDVFKKEEKKDETK